MNKRKTKCMVLGGGVENIEVNIGNEAIPILNYPNLNLFSYVSYRGEDI